MLSGLAPGPHGLISGWRRAPRDPLALGRNEIFWLPRRGEAALSLPTDRQARGNMSCDDAYLNATPAEPPQCARS